MPSSGDKLPPPKTRRLALERASAHAGSVNGRLSHCLATGRSMTGEDYDEIIGQCEEVVLLLKASRPGR